LIFLFSLGSTCRDSIGVVLFPFELAVHTTEVGETVLMYDV